MIEARQPGAFVVDEYWRHAKRRQTESRSRLYQSYSNEDGHKEFPHSKMKSFPDNLIRSLDLTPLMNAVAKHTGTRRGCQAILLLAKEDNKANRRLNTFGQRLGINSNASSSKRQRAEVSRTTLPLFFQKIQWGRPRSTNVDLAPIATTAKNARLEYELVEAATLALHNDNLCNVTYPPLYGVESSPSDTSTFAESDDDEWLGLPAEAWSLEHILQAEKVLETLLKVKEWAQLDDTMTWIPRLSGIGLLIDEERLLPPVWNDIVGSVEIVRVRSLTDPNGKSSYIFRLVGEKFPVLNLLRIKEQTIIDKGGKALDRELLTIQNEIDDLERKIQSGIARSILSVSKSIDQGLDFLARLDVIFAKAAFGLKFKGVIPRVETEGRIYVEGFVHPLLAMGDRFASGASDGEPSKIVPIDPKLASHKGDRTLIISGPNGGGKTLSMKAFGLVCVMTQIGLPIPVEGTSKRPIVDFFDRVFVNVGDKQSVLDGESTWTSSLNSCASMIQELKQDLEPDSGTNVCSLVLLDELGSGTDPEAGGAIAQAILEQFRKLPGCHVVATTHSPRLKTLSYTSPDFNCATVLLEKDDFSEYRRPNFRLEYGLIGESYAMGAASRCHPPLPESLLKRASQLLVEESSSSVGQGQKGMDYVNALTLSLEDQLERAKNVRIRTEEEARDAKKCRRAMMSLAASYEKHLDRLERRLEHCYQQFRTQQLDDKITELELVGKTLSELKVVKKQIQSQQELLKEKGLKRLPTSYRLQVGECVVVVSEGLWEGSTVQVVADARMDETLGPTEVLVQPLSSFLAWDDMMFDNDSVMITGNAKPDRPFVFQRHELAIWDYDSIWELDDERSSFGATSIPDSKRRLNSVLATLKTNDTGKNDLVTSANFGSKNNKPTKIKQSFLSARARKASVKDKKKNQK